MLDVNVELIEKLKEFVSVVASDNELLDFFRQSGNDFIRNRKLPFDKTVYLIANLCKKTLSAEIENFFAQDNGTLGCSVSAFVQQRLKLKASFFDCWNRYLCNEWYELNAAGTKRWNQYRIIAADGSNVTLVNNNNLTTCFGGQRNQQSFFTVAKTFYYYDVLNELTVQSTIGSYHCGELSMAYDMIDKTDEDMLIIYDRNFSNYKLMALHLWQEKERKFIIRAKDTLPIIKDFIASGQSSVITSWPATLTAINGLRKSGYIITKNTFLKVRLIRVELPKGTEVLITNLWEEEGYCVSQFKDLYFMRWGIETNISLQKNIMQLESFSGLTATAVEQDFYATVFLSNLHSVLIKDAQQTVDAAADKRKYPMKINKNKSFGKLKSVVANIFLTNGVIDIVRALHNFFIKYLVPVRKGRSFERVRKNPQSKSKYRTFPNFKPAY